MRTIHLMCCALVVSTGSTIAQAQESADPKAETKAGDSAFQVLGPDGEPLPPEIQQQLKDQLGDRLLQMEANAKTDHGTDGIVVAAERPRGSVLSNIPPELTFDASDVRAFGANNIGEMLEAIGPQASSQRGNVDERPVVLLNGKRVSGFAEIANIPTEAIERVEVFPEEMAVRYGYRASQKVVNIITFVRFNSAVASGSYATPTEGGQGTPSASVALLRLSQDTRLSLDATYSRSDSLLESERDIRQIAGQSSVGRFRTLLPEHERLALGTVASASLIEGVASTLSARFELDESSILNGLGPTGQPLTGHIDTRTLHVGVALAGQLGKWQWSFNGGLDRRDTSTQFDVAPSDQITRNRAEAEDELASADLLLAGDAFTLPAGPAAVSLRALVDRRGLETRSEFGGIEQQGDLSRRRAALLANTELPLWGRRDRGLGAIGSLSLNFNAELEHLSDFGTLSAFGTGLNWEPTEEVSIVASVGREMNAPTLEQLGAPVVVTPNLRTFDFGQSETVDLARTSGGNGALLAEERKIVSIGLSARPIPETDLTLSIDYLNLQIDDPIADFPLASPQIETAFPDRFQRDEENRLLAVDSRPVNFARSVQERVRFGLSFSRPLGEVPAAMKNTKVRYAASEADLQRRLPAGATLAPAAPGSPAARMAETLASRVYVNIGYTLRLEDNIKLSENGPTIDLLDGSAVDLRGGRPRHEVDLQVGAAKRGLGARFSANWSSPTTATGLASFDTLDGELRFASYGTINLNVFANLAERFGGAAAPGWMKGSRVSLNVVNLLNERPQVRDLRGLTPVNYQPAYLNPIGRMVSVSLRKSF